MKLEAPPRYSGKKQPSVRTWLSQMEQYMRLMKYVPTDWLDVMAMRVDGATGVQDVGSNQSGNDSLI